MVSGVVIAPRRVEKELTDWQRSIATMKDWLHHHRYLFRDIESDEQLALAKRIVNDYPAYCQNKNYLGDLEVITLAGVRELTVITLEGGKQTPSKKRPKIPDVCSEFGIECVSLPGFLRREGFGRQEA